MAETQTPDPKSMVPTSPNRPEKPPSPPNCSPETGSPAAAPPASRTLREDLAVAVAAKAEVGTEGGGEKGSRVVSGILRRSKREAAVGRAGAGVRIAAAALTLISFSVMAADKTKGWAGDSFDRYKQYRFCLSVNVLAFAYSTFQIYAYVHRIINDRHIIRAPIRYYFDLFVDQILAYLLLAASSTAATMNDVWVSNWGHDPFTVMINGSVSMSFLAFAAFAIVSLISAHNLFSRNI